MAPVTNNCEFHCNCQVNIHYMHRRYFLLKTEKQIENISGKFKINFENTTTQQVALTTMSDRTAKEAEKKEGLDIPQNGLGEIPTDSNLNGGVVDNNKSQIPSVDLDRMVADSLKDIDVYEDDGDDDDPELLKELSEIIKPNESQQNVAAVQPHNDIILPTTNLVPELLKTRIEMYKIAEMNALAANESGRARRFARGLNTLETMMREALEGKDINMADIPPEVIHPKVTDGPESPTPTTTEKDAC